MLWRAPGLIGLGSARLPGWSQIALILFQRLRENLESLMYPEGRDMTACSCRSLSARLPPSVQCRGVESMAWSRNDIRQERSDNSEESGTEQHIRNTTSDFPTHFKVLDIEPMRGFLSEAANFCLQLVLTTIRRMCLPRKETLVFCAFRPLGRAARSDRKLSALPRSLVV